MNGKEKVAQLFTMLQMSIAASTNMKMTTHNETFKEYRLLKLELL